MVNALTAWSYVDAHASGSHRGKSRDARWVHRLNDRTVTLTAAPRAPYSSASRLRAPPRSNAARLAIPETRMTVAFEGPTVAGVALRLEWVERGIARITLTRPAQINSLSLELLSEFDQALD